MFRASFIHPTDCEETVNIIADGETRDDELRKRKNLMQRVHTKLTPGKLSSELREKATKSERLNEGDVKFAFLISFNFSSEQSVLNVNVKS